MISTRIGNMVECGACVCGARARGGNISVLLTIFFHLWNLFDEQLRLNGNITFVFSAAFFLPPHSSTR